MQNSYDRDTTSTQLREITDKIYEIYWESPKVTNAVWNYSAQIQWLITIFEEKELYDRWINKLNNLLTRKITINDFINLKEKESKKLNELINIAFNKYWELTKEAKIELINEFKKTLTN